MIGSMYRLFHNNTIVFLPMLQRDTESGIRGEALPRVSRAWFFNKINDCTQERCCATAVNERETALNSKIDPASNLRGGSRNDYIVILARVTRDVCAVSY